LWNRNNGTPLRAVLVPYPPKYTSPSPLAQDGVDYVSSGTSPIASDRAAIECIDMEGDIMAVGAHDAVFIWDITLLLHGCPFDEPLSAMLKSDNPNDDLAISSSSSSWQSRQSISGDNRNDGLLLTLWHPGVRTVRLLRQSWRRVVTLGGTHVCACCQIDDKCNIMMRH
jgi:hypothetical protein